MAAWRSLMVYMGGLTFDSDDPSKFLKIPNLIAAKRFGSALLDRLRLYSSIKNAPYTLSQTRNPAKEETISTGGRVSQHHAKTRDRLILRAGR
jgi:hypothetical protein